MSTTPVLGLALLSAALLGFRHGFDYDHVAAISDIASAQKSPRQAMKVGLWYALGHAATVALLGSVVIFFQASLPERLDSLFERLVGLTLLALGVYVLWTSIFTSSHGHAHPPRTRMVLLINAGLWLVWRLRQSLTRTPVRRRALFADGISATPAVVVGVIHGLGAETPTQILLFLLAVNLGGFAKGLLGLAIFIGGMIAMNTLMCAAAAGLFHFAASRQRTFQWVAGVSAAYSMIVGAIFLLGPGAVFAAIR